MRKVIAAGAIVAAATGSLFGFAGHASAQSLTVAASGDTSGACLSVSWDFPDPTNMIPVGLPVGLPVAIPFSGSQGKCLSASDLPGLPSLPSLPSAPSLP